MKLILKSISGLFLLIGLIFIILLGLASILNYNPPEKTLLFSSEEASPVKTGKSLNLLTWNIGYCGLDAGMDFFYDGGENVRPAEENVRQNLNAVCSELQKADTTDFYLLQEVDHLSRRSYKIDQYDTLVNLKKDYFSFPGINYRIFFVPVPLTNPMGKVYSGLQTLSAFQPESVCRYSFPGNFKWPVSLFMLDRCFLVNRYPVDNGKEFLLINTHNSAYDDGSLRRQQMDYLNSFLKQEYARGNYIIVGGDWNQSPPGILKEFDGQPFDTVNFTEIPGSFFSDWNWVWDPKVPTNRRVKTPYTHGETCVTLIDFFLCSPNIRVLDIQAKDLYFEHSDHNPVALKIQLNDL